MHAALDRIVIGFDVFGDMRITSTTPSNHLIGFLLLLVNMIVFYCSIEYLFLTAHLIEMCFILYTNFYSECAQFVSHYIDSQAHDNVMMYFQ